MTATLQPNSWPTSFYRSIEYESWSRRFPHLAELNRVNGLGEAFEAVDHRLGANRYAAEVTARKSADPETDPDARLLAHLQEHGVGPGNTAYVTGELLRMGEQEFHAAVMRWRATDSPDWLHIDSSGTSFGGPFRYTRIQLRRR